MGVLGSGENEVKMVRELGAWLKNCREQKKLIRGAGRMASKFPGIR